MAVSIRAAVVTCVLTLGAALVPAASAAETTSSSTSVPCRKDFLQPNGGVVSDAVLVDQVQAVEQFEAAAALSDAVAMSETGFTVVQRKWNGLTSGVSQFDLDGNVLLQERLRRTTKLISTTYWNRSSGTELSRIGMSARDKRALALLGRPDARWIADVHNPGSHWSARVEATSYIYPPNAANAIHSVRAFMHGSRISQYVFDVSDYERGRFMSAVCLDESGRISRFLLPVDDLDNEFVYANPTITIPDEDLRVDGEEFRLAVDAANGQAKLGTLRKLISADVLWATRAEVVASTRYFVQRLAHQWLIKPKWAETKSGSKVWFRNPFNGEIEGLEFVAVPNALVRVVKFSSTPSRRST